MLRDDFLRYRETQVVPGLKLWEFILELLLLDEHQNILTWTGKDMVDKYIFLRKNMIMSVKYFAKR